MQFLTPRFLFRLIPALGCLALLALFIHLGQWQAGKAEQGAARLALFEARSKAPPLRIETQLALIHELKPEVVIALHAPLACIDDANQSPLGRWLAERTGMAFVADVGYPTPGSFGTWGGENGVPVITYEFPMTSTDALVREHVPVLVELPTRWPVAGGR